MMWWWNDYWPMPAGPFMLIVVAVLFVAVMLFMVREMPGGHRDRTDSSVALDILKERFARGEITQLNLKKNAVSSKPPSTNVRPGGVIHDRKTNIPRVSG
jgi:hypothetical protein